LPERAIEENLQSKNTRCSGSNVTPETCTFKAGVPNIKPQCSIKADIETTLRDKKLSLFHASEVSCCLHLNYLLDVTEVLSD